MATGTDLRGRLGEYQPPGSCYMLGEEADGIHPEFLAPLKGREYSNGGEHLATEAVAGVVRACPGSVGSGRVPMMTALVSGASMPGRVDAWHLWYK